MRTMVKQKMNKIEVLPFLTAIVVFCLFISCSGDNAEKTVEAIPPAQASQMQPQEQMVDEIEEKPVYVYSGDRFRDPFVEIGQSTAYTPDAIFSPEQAKVKAIIYSGSIKSAVVQVAGSGSYYIKGNRIFDVMGKNVSGFSARIFPEKVVITVKQKTNIH